MSDLHLEIGQQYATFHIVPRAPSSILAGDIGRLADYEAFRDFLIGQCEQFTRVYLVLENHEFFGVSRQEGLALAAQLQQEGGLQGNLVILNRRRVDLDNNNITILGCTLHSYIPREAEEIVELKINDFRRIKDWTVAEHNAEHTRDVGWLVNEITSIRRTEKNLTTTIVVITHHAPSTKGTSKPSQENNPWSSAFATGLLDGNEDEFSYLRDEVQWWIFGHTHHCSESVKGTVKLVGNQRGYVFPSSVDDSKQNQILARFVTSMQRFWKPDGKEEQDTFSADRVIEV